MKVVCELSGGADSALAAVYAKKKYPGAEFYGLFVDYGQPYALQERRASVSLAIKIFGFGYTWDRVEVRRLFNNVPKEQLAANVASEYYPLRNLVITALAASYAVRMGAEVIVNGSKSLSRVETDPYSFRDSTLPFYLMMEAVINTGMEGGRLRIEPVLSMGRESKMSKTQVFQELIEAGISPDQTWSCYHPTEMGEACGWCRNCKDRKEILAKII